MTSTIWYFRGLHVLFFVNWLLLCADLIRHWYTLTWTSHLVAIILAASFLLLWLSLRRDKASLLSFLFALAALSTAAHVAFPR